MAGPRIDKFNDRSESDGPLRICLLTDQDLDADPFPKDDWPCNPRPHLPDAEWTVLTLEKESCVAEVIRAADKGYDLFFNLCDGAWAEGRVGIEVVVTLEELGVPFTGADSAFFEPTREAMKRVCQEWGLHTPAYRFASDEADVAEAADVLQFPLFVKHPNSYASTGLTRDSKVEDREQLLRQARLIIDKYGSALIEEYIAGTEVTALVAENADDPDAPIVYPPIKYRFPEGEAFKHYDLKWITYDGLEATPVDDDELTERITKASAEFFRGIRGAGYGRVDFRVDAEGTPFILEINPNCGLYYPPTDPASADLILMETEGGHAEFTRRVVAAAMARNRRRQKAWRVGQRPDGAYGVFARQDVAAGRTVIDREAHPAHLVSLAHVLKQWDERRRAQFDRHAWPLTEDTWVMRSPDPEEWQPINHSCDPNAWLDGLNVVARRDIAAGDEITLDYATFRNERMPSFECSCGAAACRGVVRGTDYLDDFVSRYGDHVSDYVRRQRAERG